MEELALPLRPILLEGFGEGPDFMATLEAHVEEQESVPGDRGKNHYGPEDGEWVVHGIACGLDCFVRIGLGERREPISMPAKESPKEEAPAISGLIGLAFGNA